ncbi:SGNH/GDSL hydrolase family protein [Candidatus Woesearchaeota archaeon]|nr:SGNH/GDSL hydrolase family protein [Candidatus Woesearchaeota archaeon]
MNLKKADWSKIVLLLATSLFCFLILEFTARFQLANNGHNLGYSEFGNKFDMYGWSTPENTSINTTILDHGNVTRSIMINYYLYGFKRWGNPGSSNPKILVLGDSYTEMDFVSNGEEWYSYLTDYFDDAELFVYGAGGYGTFQEYLILDSYIDKITPDIIIWQFCYNDLSNNLFELESAGFVATRSVSFKPYLVDGKISYRVPRMLWRFRKRSALFSFLLNLYDDYIEEPIWKRYKYKNLGNLYEKYLNDSLEKTIEIFRLAEDRAEGVPIYMFDSCSGDDVDLIICAETNLTCIHGLYDYVYNQHLNSAEAYVPGDGHWNLAGNKFAGNYLTDYFEMHRIEEQIEGRTDKNGSWI